VAAPRVHLGSRAEVDVASFERAAFNIDASKHQRSDDRDAVATATWVAQKPTLEIETELGDFDEYEIRVYDASRDRRLVAAIELISPGNKDRPENRQQFVSECAALLRQQVSVVLVDIVVSKNFNLYAELLRLFGHDDRSLGFDPPSIYAVACRWTPRGTKNYFEAWNYPLANGQALPVLPLWLSETVSVPLDLETSYEKTCQDLRIV
jgi:hypothetical protein